MAGVCSVHKHKEPGCVQCHVSPRELFPNWKEMVAQVMQTCPQCKFEFYQTKTCPKCGPISRVVSLIEVSNVHDSLCNELLWFIGEWAKSAGYADPRFVQKKNGSFEVRVVDK